MRRYRDNLNRLFRAATDLGNPDTPSAISYRDIERIINAVKPKDPLDLRVTKSKTRDSWTEERLAKFLTCPIFKGCFSEHRRWRPGNIIIRDAFYWVPSIVLTIGSRIKEILLLKRDNLRLRNGVFCLAVGLDADHSNKTESARRYVPIPQLLNRSLVYLLRDHVFDCPICRQPHVHHSPKNQYQSIEIASEPVTFAEDWYEVPNQTVFRAGQDYRLDMEPLRMPA